MELELEEKLQEKYQNLIIEVEFVDFRIYAIIVKMEFRGNIYESKIIYKYRVDLTLTSNTNIIEGIIDKKIIIPFYKKGE